MFTRKLYLIIFLLSLVVILVTWVILSNNTLNHPASPEDTSRNMINHTEEVIIFKKNDLPQADVASTLDKSKDVLSKDANTIKREMQVEHKYDNSLIQILNLLSIDIFDITEKLDQYKNNDVYAQWQIRINSNIGGSLNEEQKEAIKTNHLIFLCVKDELDRGYLGGADISHEEYKKNLASLFKWHQKTYQNILSEENYEKLFEISSYDTDRIIDSTINMIPEIEITNRETTIDDVYQIVPGYKIERLAMLFRERQLEAKIIGEKVNSSEITPEEAIRIYNEYHQNYIAQAKEILEPEEFLLIFGSPSK